MEPAFYGSWSRFMTVPIECRLHYIILKGSRQNCYLLLRQHRTMGTAGFGGSFAPIVQYEKWEIHPVFPHFSYFRLCQNLAPNLLAPLCGAALTLHTRASLLTQHFKLLTQLHFQLLTLHSVIVPPPTTISPSYSTTA